MELGIIIMEKITIRMSRQLYQQAKARAALERKTVGAWIMEAITLKLEEPPMLLTNKREAINNKKRVD